MVHGYDLPFFIFQNLALGNKPAVPIILVANSFKISTDNNVPNSPLSLF
jgi:hypothetical protein